MTEERFVRIICISLKVLAWFLLISGIFASIAVSTVLVPMLLLNRWSGAVVLFLFILIFLFINLVIKMAEMVLKIKKKVEAK